MASRQEFNQAKARLIKAIALNKVKLSASDNYLKIQQGGRTIRLPLISSQAGISVNSFK